MFDNMNNTHPHPLDSKYQFLSVLIPNHHPHVVIVVLNRPKKLNAIHSRMWKEIGAVFGELGRLGDDCRCVLLLGSGRAFCSGIDIADLSFISTNESDDVARIGIAMTRKVQQMQACFTALETCPVPVVVAMHGMCVGAGMDLACCGDIRVCADSTIFSVREVKMGLAADVGTLQRLPKITGNSSWVNDVCLTGRNFTAKEALSVGYVSQILPSNEYFTQALELCHSISINSPVAVQGTKKALLYARDHTVADSLEQIIAYNALALQSEDLPKSIEAALQKKQAVFENLLPHSKL